MDGEVCVHGVRKRERKFSSYFVGFHWMDGSMERHFWKGKENV
jgi:hypothetical protein